MVSNNAFNLMNWLAGGKARFVKGRFVRADGDTFMASRRDAADLISERPALARYIGEDELELTPEGTEFVERAKKINAARFGRD